VQKAEVGSRKLHAAPVHRAGIISYFHFILYTSHGVIRFGLQAEFFRRNSLYFAVFEDYEVGIGLDGDFSGSRGRTDEGVQRPAHSWIFGFGYVVGFHWFSSGSRSTGVIFFG
jgi:hypothetical protein